MIWSLLKFFSTYLKLAQALTTICLQCFMKLRNFVTVLVGQCGNAFLLQISISIQSICSVDLQIHTILNSVLAHYLDLDTTLMNCVLNGVQRTFFLVFFSSF